MKKPLKILAVFVATILLILGLGIAYLSFIFDPNQFKSQLVEFVKEKHHRDLSIEGRIQLQFFPKLGVSLEKVQLSEFDSKEVFAKLNQAKISLALMPLLQKQIVVDKIAVDALQLSYHRDPAGRTNIDDLIGKETKKDTETGDTTKNQTMRFDIEGIAITNAEFAIDDQKSDLRGKITGLNLTTGKIADQQKAPVSFDAQLQFEQPKVNVKTNFNTIVSFNANSKTVILENLTTLINGQFDKESLDLQVESKQIKLHREQTASEFISLKAKFGGTQTIKSDLAIHQLDLKDEQLQIGRLELNASAQQGNASKQIELQTPVNMNTRTQVIDLSQLAVQLKLQDPAMGQPQIIVPIKARAEIGLKDKYLKSHIDAKFDESSLQAKLEVQDFSSPTINFTMNLDRINLDRYVKSKENTATTEDKPEQDLKLDSLKKIKLDGAIKIGQLQVKNLHIEQIQLPIRSHDGEFTMNGIAAKLYQGSVAGNMRFQVDGNQFEMQQKLSSIQIHPLLMDFMSKDIVEGKGNLNLQIKTHGKRVSQFKDNLNGTIHTQLVDGAVKGINLAKSLRDFKAKITNKTDQQQAANKNEKTDFSALSASIVFIDGIGNSDDLDMKSPFLRVGGKGRIDLRASNLDYTAKVTVVNTSAGQDGADLSQLKDISIPVRISGPFDKLGYQIQFAQIGSEALKSAFKAKAAPVIEEKKKELKEKVNEQLKDKLKGLFGK
ncbi:AsmA family protein [Undibacterium fentianense]|uniref:AsmA family protein n=1 Tax=Undibacterium fentianense TaxID=2828728 RepID=A0A941IEC8_9BURK|nr:AsmA family protein [Undibacterium fentianense]MBR7800958.1 AsmA family protein [Undibacterium fentianense]